ncbi:MAG TPA: hypothetical protein VHG09_11270 [Longimicrobiales bacterium]|nr:hypothetical protein [Longimicrobiales bacterium]
MNPPNRSDTPRAQSDEAQEREDAARETQPVVVSPVAPTPAPASAPVAAAVPAAVPAAARSIRRPDFEQVIRRAAELSLRETDPDDNLSEDEVLRISAELGLPLQHVRQALFELPDLKVQPRWYDRWFGPAVFSVSRVVPTRKEPALRRVEDYLVTREYLQIVRRKGDTIAFVPADDAISSVARAFARPGSRHTISRASRMMVGVHTLPEDDSHVRFDVDLSDTRKEAVRSGVSFGSIIGLSVGTLAVAVFDAVPGSLADISGMIAFGTAMGGSVAGSVAASISLSASRFRNRVFGAKMELTGLLDRLERGDRLDPPPAPWRRKLQLRLFGDRR